MTRSATSSMVSSMLLIRRGLNAAETIRRRRAWRGLSVEIMPAKYSTISGGQVEDADRALPRAVDLRVPADLDHIGVAGDRPVAGPGRRGQGRGLGGHVGLLEEGQRALAAQQCERALALGPRPLPEGEVGEVDLVEAEHATRGSWRLTLPTASPAPTGLAGRTSRSRAAAEQRGPGLVDPAGRDQREPTSSMTPVPVDRRRSARPVRRRVSAGLVERARRAPRTRAGASGDPVPQPPRPAPGSRRRSRRPP